MNALPKPPPKAAPKAPPKQAAPAAPAAVPVRPAVTASSAAIQSAPAPAAKPNAAPLAAAAAKPAAASPQFQAADRDLPAMVAPLVEAMRLYDELLGTENAMLRRHDTAGVSSLLDRKQAVTLLYQERLKDVLQERETLQSMPPEQRVRLHKLAHTLEERAAENAVLLRASMNAIERLFEAINSAVREERNRDVTYSKAGRIDGVAAGGAAIAFNGTF